MEDFVLVFVLCFTNNSYSLPKDKIVLEEIIHHTSFLLRVAC